MNSQDSSGEEINQPIDGVALRKCKQFTDQRGWLIEIFRQDELAEAHWPRMAYISETLPGVARGPHEHVDQSDLLVFLGPGDFRIYLWDSRKDSSTRGNRIAITVGQCNPHTVLVPAGVVHAYKNVSSIPGLVFNAPNRLFAGDGRQEAVDEIRHEDRKDSPYVLF
jgi:dTDP-4-dehydrorhamnose 3,5-epimerase